MKSESVLYNGKAVQKDKFRAYVYSGLSDSKLANSWDEFQDLLTSGMWHATKEQAINLAGPNNETVKLEEFAVKEKPKSRKKKG